MLRQGLLDLIVMLLFAILSQAGRAPSVLAGVLLSVRAVEQLFAVEEARAATGSDGHGRDGHGRDGRSANGEDQSSEDNAYAAALEAGVVAALSLTLDGALQATTRTAEPKGVLLVTIQALSRLCRGSASRTKAVAAGLAPLATMQTLVDTCNSLASDIAQCTTSVDGGDGVDEMTKRATHVSATPAAVLKAAVQLLATLAEDEAAVKMVVMHDESQEQEQEQDQGRQRRVQSLEELLNACSNQPDPSTYEAALVFTARIFAHHPSAKQLVDMQSTIAPSLLNVCAFGNTCTAASTARPSLTMVAYASAGVTNMCTNSMAGHRGSGQQGGEGRSQPGLHPLLAAHIQSLQLDLGNDAKKPDDKNDERDCADRIDDRKRVVRLARLCEWNVASSLLSMLQHCTTLGIGDKDASASPPLLLRANTSRAAHTLATCLSSALRSDAADSGSGKIHFTALEEVGKLLLCLWQSQLQVMDVRLSEGVDATVAGAIGSSQGCHREGTMPVHREGTMPVHPTDSEASVLELTVSSLSHTLRGINSADAVSGDMVYTMVQTLLQSGVLQLLRRLFRAALLEEEESAPSLSSAASPQSSSQSTAQGLVEGTATAATLVHAATVAELMLRLSSARTSTAAQFEAICASFRTEMAEAGMQADVNCGRRRKGAAGGGAKKSGSSELGIVASLRSMILFCNTRTVLAERVSGAVVGVLKVLLSALQEQGQGRPSNAECAWGAECALLLVRAQLGLVKLLVFLAGGRADNTNISGTCRVCSLQVLLLLCAGGGDNHSSSNSLWVARASLRKHGVDELVRRLRRETMGSVGWSSAEQAEEVQQLALKLQERLEENVKEDMRQVAKERSIIEEEDEDGEGERGIGSTTESSNGVDEGDSEAGHGEGESTQATNAEIEETISRFRGLFLERMCGTHFSESGWAPHVAEVEESIRAVKGLLPSRRCRVLLLKAGLVDCLCHYQVHGGSQFTVANGTLPWVLARHDSGVGGGEISAGVKTRMASVRRDLTEAVAVMSEDDKYALTLAEGGGAGLLVRLIACVDVGEMKPQHLRTIERCAAALENIMKRMTKKLAEKGGKGVERGVKIERLQQAKRMLGEEGTVLATLTALLSRAMADEGVAMRWRVARALRAACELWGGCVECEAGSSHATSMQKLLVQVPVVQGLLHVLGVEEMERHRELVAKTNRFKQQHLRGIVLAAAAALAVLTAHTGEHKGGDRVYVTASMESPASFAAAEILKHDGSHILLQFCLMGALAGARPALSLNTSAATAAIADTAGDSWEVYYAVSSIMLGCSLECVAAASLLHGLEGNDKRGIDEAHLLNIAQTIELLCRECNNTAWVGSAKSDSGGSSTASVLLRILQLQERVVQHVMSAAAVLSDGSCSCPLISQAAEFAPVVGKVCLSVTEFRSKDDEFLQSNLSQICRIVSAHCNVGCDTGFQLALNGGIIALELGLGMEPTSAGRPLLAAVDRLVSCAAVGAHAAAGAFDIQWQHAGNRLGLSHSSRMLGRLTAAEADDEQPGLSYERVLAIARMLNSGEGAEAQLVSLKQSTLGLLKKLTRDVARQVKAEGHDRFDGLHLDLEDKGEDDEDKGEDDAESLITISVRCIGGVAAFDSALRATQREASSGDAVSALCDATRLLLRLLAATISETSSSLQATDNAAAGEDKSNGPEIAPRLQQLLVSVLATLAVVTRNDTESAVLAVAVLTEGGEQRGDGQIEEEAAATRKLRVTSAKKVGTLLETLVGVATAGTDALLLAAGLDTTVSTSAKGESSAASAAMSWALKEPAMGVLLGLCSHQESLDALLASPSTLAQARTLLSKLLQTSTTCTLADIRAGDHSDKATNAANRQSRERTLVLCAQTLAGCCMAGGNDGLSTLLHAAAEVKANTVCSLWCRSLLFHRDLCADGGGDGETQRIKEQIQQMQKEWHGSTDKRHSNGLALLYRWGRLQLTLTGFTRLASLKSVSTGAHGLLVQAGEGAGGGVALLLRLLHELLADAKVSSTNAQRTAQEQDRIKGRVAVGSMLISWDAAEVAGPSAALQYRLCDERCACMRLVCVALCKLVGHLRLRASEDGASGISGESVCEMIGLHRSTAISDLVALLMSQDVCVTTEVGGDNDSASGSTKDRDSSMLPVAVRHAAVCAVSCFADLGDEKLRNDLANASTTNALVQIIHQNAAPVNAGSAVETVEEAVVQQWPRSLPGVDVDQEVWLLQEEDGSTLGGQWAVSTQSMTLLMSSMRALGKICHPHPLAKLRPQFSPAVQPHLVPAHIQCRTALAASPLPTMALLLQILTSDTRPLVLAVTLRVLAALMMSGVWPQTSDSHLELEGAGAPASAATDDGTAPLLGLDIATDVVRALQCLLKLAALAPHEEREEWGGVVRTSAAILWGIGKQVHLQGVLSAEVLEALVRVVVLSFGKHATAAVVHYSLTLLSSLALTAEQPSSYLQMTCDEKPTLLDAIIAALVHVASSGNGSGNGLFTGVFGASSEHSLRGTACAHTSTILKMISDFAIGRRALASIRDSEEGLSAVSLLRTLQQGADAAEPGSGDKTEPCNAYSARQAAAALANLSSDQECGAIQDSDALREQGEDALNSLKINCGVDLDGQGGDAGGDSGLAVAEQAARSLCALASGAGHTAREELCTMGAPAVVVRIVGAIAAVLVATDAKGGSTSSSTGTALLGRLRLMRHLLGTLAGMAEHKRSREVLMRTTGGDLKQGGVYAWLLTLLTSAKVKPGSDEERALRFDISAGAILALERFSIFADGRRRSLTSFSEGLQTRLSTMVRTLLTTNAPSYTAHNQSTIVLKQEFGSNDGFVLLFLCLQESLKQGWEMIMPLLEQTEREDDGSFSAPLTCTRLVECLARTAASAVGVIDAKGLRNTMVVPTMMGNVRNFSAFCAKSSGDAPPSEAEQRMLWGMSKYALVLILVRNSTLHRKHTPS
jgi:hypothetical protein